MDYYRDSIETVKQSIREKADEDLIRTDTVKLVDFYVSQFELPTIKKDTSQRVGYDRGNASDDAWERHIELSILYPIILEEKLEEVVTRQSSSFYPSMPEIEIQDSYLATKISVSRSISEDIIGHAIKTLEQMIEWKNDDVSKGNGSLRNEIRQFIDMQKNRIEEDTELIERLVQKVQIPLERKKTVDILGLDLKVKKRISLVMPKPEIIQQPELPYDQFLDIVNTIKNTGQLFEKTPNAYSKLGETDLRDILLLGLNMMYMFAGYYATGETFNKSGKTDIYLNIPNGKNLVAECKLWEGPEYYRNAIGQLLSYLTWRENYAILITFSKNKDFPEVMSRAKSTAIQNDRLAPNSLREVGSGHFVTQHFLLSNDSERKVEVHHLLFYLELKQGTNA